MPIADLYFAIIAFALGFALGLTLGSRRPRAETSHARTVHKTRKQKASTP